MTEPDKDALMLIEELDSIQRSMDQATKRLRSLAGFLLFLWLPLIVLGVLGFEDQAERAVLIATLGGAGLHALVVLLEYRSLRKKEMILLSKKARTDRLPGEENHASAA